MRNRKTGIKTKNNHEIYEGDIISLNGLKFVCEWFNHGFIFRGIENKNYVISLNPGFDKSVEFNVEGNIYGIFSSVEEYVEDYRKNNEYKF